MSLQTAADITVLISSPSSSSERRISPSWTIGTLKSKLLPVTGIPPANQSLTLRLPSSPTPISISALDEQTTTLVSYPLQQYCEIYVDDTRPPSQRPNFTDTSSVEKFVLPADEYQKRTDSVLAWKKRNQLGRFDPNKDENEKRAHEAAWKEVESRGIEAGKRCKVGERRGTVRYIGEVAEIPAGGVWIGVESDEPTGKNDGSINGARYFTCKPKHGSFVRAERVEIGDFSELDDDLEEM